MIERLTTTLRLLAYTAPPDLSPEDRRRAAADCADAIRLELDCPQQELTPLQRDTLIALGDLLDVAPDALDGTAVRDAARSAATTLGLAPDG